MGRSLVPWAEIGGAGFGGGGKGGGRQKTPTEQPDNLQSIQTAKVVDLISEGPIRGVVGGPAGVYLDGVRLQNPDGTYNWQNAIMQFVNGWPGQPIMNGFTGQAAEQSVGIQLRYNQPATRTIINPNVDRARLTFATPGLQTVDKETGDVSGATISWAVYIQSKGGGFKFLGNVTLSGKTSSRYQRSVLISMPGGSAGAPWDIRVNRLTADSTTETLQNDLYWDSYSELIDDRINYHLSACVGTIIRADQFNAIPKRTYYVQGLYCYIPNNYDPFQGTYSGVWSGTWAYNWTNNPAWVLWDLITNGRYGLGDFLTFNDLDRWAFYKVAQWCDGQVPDGRGGYERRWTCNVQISSQSEAFDLLNSIAGIFRGFTYWNGGTMQVFADQPADPLAQFTNANVIGGTFSYMTSDIRQRHTQIIVNWRDPALLGEPRQAIVEDAAAVSKFGLQTLDIDAVACTSEGQAHRIGKWELYSQQYEAESITFDSGLETTYVRPGDIIRVMDINVGGKRRGGRVALGTTASDVYFDAPITSIVNDTWYLTCMLPSGAIEQRVLSLLYPTHGVPSTPFSAAPPVNTTWVLVQAGNLEATLWRTLNVKQNERDQYSVEAVRHYPAKWDYVENNLALSEPDISDLSAVPAAVLNLTVAEYLIQLSPISVGVRATISWESAAPGFDVGFRDSGKHMNWSIVRTDQHAYDLPVTEGEWQFQVTPVSAIGLKGPTVTLTKTIIGRFFPPLEPQQFRVKISDGVALFEWLPSKEIDVIIGGHFELRHSSRTSGATWAASQVVVPSIPGSATTVEAVYRTGTWMLRTFDIVGVPSDKAAVIIALQPDGRYTEFVRICENPDFLGSRFYTEVLQPQQWLVLGRTGGLWDDQMAAMDDWPDVDVLVENAPAPPQSEPRHGWYLFDNRIDAGGIFTVRFSADILAFPYAEGSEFIDDRLIYCDDWVDWDDVGEDLQGQVQLFIRTTNQDPASPGVVWTEWQVFSPMEYTARAFEFRADLWAPQGQNIGIEELCIIADLRMKMDSDEDVPYPAATTHVTFTAKFYLVPAVVVTVQDALATDTIQVINKDRLGFDLNITNAGAQVTRVFDWQARGF